MERRNLGERKEMAVNERMTEDSDFLEILRFLDSRIC